jgi:hypothetical protein
MHENTNAPTTPEPHPLARILDGAATYARVSADPLTVELLGGNGAGIRATLTQHPGAAGPRIHVETVKYNGDTLTDHEAELDIAVLAGGMVVIHQVRV